MSFISIDFIVYCITALGQKLYNNKRKSNIFIINNMHCVTFYIYYFVCGYNNFGKFKFYLWEIKFCYIVTYPIFIIFFIRKKSVIKSN